LNLPVNICQSFKFLQSNANHLSFILKSLLPSGLISVLIISYHSLLSPISLIIFFNVVLTFIFLIETSLVLKTPNLFQIFTNNCFVSSLGFSKSIHIALPSIPIFVLIVSASKISHAIFLITSDVSYSSSSKVSKTSSHLFISISVSSKSSVHFCQTCTFISLSPFFLST